MSNTHDTNVLRDSAQYRAEVEIEFQHLRKLLEIFQKVGLVYSLLPIQFRQLPFGRMLHQREIREKWGSRWMNSKKRFGTSWEATLPTSR